MEKQILVAVAWADMIVYWFLRAIPWLVIMILCVLAIMTITKGDRHGL